MPKAHRKTVTVSMDPALLKRVQRVSDRLGVPRSQFICSCIIDALDESEMQAKLLGDKKVMGAFHKAMSSPGVMSSLARAMGEEITDKQQTQLRDLLGGLGKIEGKS